jgi:hypothetical protein
MEALPDESDTPNLVTNMEVIQILSEQIQEREDRKKDNPRVRQRDWIEEQVHLYLTQITPLTRQRDLLPLVRQLRDDYKLTNAEILQILNFLPTESVETHMIIEDLPSRFSDEQEEELLKLIASYRATPGEASGEQNKTEDVDMEDSKPPAVENGGIPRARLKKDPPS